jgi:parallel beta-helix repeat protein
MAISLFAFVPTHGYAAIIDVYNGDNLQSKIQNAQPGDTLLVRNGTYGSPEYGIYIYKKKGRPDAWITVKAYPGHTPVILGGAWAAVKIQYSAYIEINGFKLQGAGLNGNPSGSGIESEKSSHHIKIINNTVDNFPGGGIGAINSNHILIEGNRISNVAYGYLPNNSSVSYAHSAISLYQLTNQGGTTPSYDGFMNVIRGNIITNARNEKPFVYSAYGQITDGNCVILDDMLLTQTFGQGFQSGGTQIDGPTLVENNICHNNGGRGIHNYLAKNVVVRNNTLYRNGYVDTTTGELVANNSQNISFYNNIVYARTGKAYIKNQKSTNILFNNNLVWGSDIYEGDQGAILKADPLFIDATQINFALRSNSPAIGKSLAEQCPKTDIFGKVRTSTSCDLGALQSDFVAAPTPAPTPAPTTPSAPAIRLEAENLTLKTFRKENVAIASNGTVASLVGYGTSENGTLTTNIAVPTGKYNIVLSYFDENDGIGSLAVQLNRTTLASWKMNLNLKQGWLSNQNQVRRVVAQGVTLRSGDQLIVRGAENGGEYVRVDYIDLIPVP